MGSGNLRMTLREQIAEILGTAGPSLGAGRSGGARLAVHKSIACGSMMLLAMNPGRAGAAGLGEVHLKSNLGQPLVATVPLILGDGESLRQDCVQPAPASGSLRQPPDLRVVSPARTGPGAYEIRVTTANPLREPMYELSLMIKCTGASLLIRQYVLMLDLPGMPPTEATPETGATTSAPVAPRTRSVRGSADAARGQPFDPARALPPRTDRIPSGSWYRVSRGDSLSTIARRVEGRPADTIWQVADRIFADNPEAFIRNDPNMIKLGSLIRVPDAGVLATMKPGGGRPITAAAGGRPTVTAAAADSVRDRAPTQPPASESRAEVAAAGQSPEPVTEPAANQMPDPGPAPVQATTTPPEPQAVAGTEPNANLGTATIAPSYPFADEQPSQPPVIDAAPATERDAPQRPAVTAGTPGNEMAGAEQPNSFLWILIGLLLSGALALLLLRGRLLAALGVGRRSQKIAVPGAMADATAASQTGTFNESIAARAFGVSDDTTGSDAIPVAGPIEDTYIVEMSPAEPTMEQHIDTLRPHAAEPDRAVARPEVQEAAADDDDSAELARLFGAEDDTGDGVATPADEGPTAEMPRGRAEPLEPTAEMPIQPREDLEPTAEMPLRDADETFDPTADLTLDAFADIFDPSGGVDDPVGEVEPLLRDAFAEDADLLADEPATEAREVALDDPLEQALMDDATVESEFADLPGSDAEEDKLSATLTEALTLLEREFEEEFTASQILERSSLEKQLEEDLDSEETDRAKSRKNRNIG